MREWMYNSGTLQQKRTMSTSYWSVCLCWGQRAHLCQSKVSEWHMCISEPITKTLWIPFGLKNWFTLKVHYSIIYCCCSTFVLSKFNNSGFTYIRCSKWKVYYGWVSHSSRVSLLHQCYISQIVLYMLEHLLSRIIKKPLKNVLEKWLKVCMETPT